jgi:hypothetical protein
MRRKDAKYNDIVGRVAIWKKNAMGKNLGKMIERKVR